MTPEAMISIVTGLALGLLALAANRIKLALVLGSLVAMGVEAYAAWRGPSWGARRIRKKSYANSSSVPATPDCSLLTGQSVSRVKR